MYSDRHLFLRAGWLAHVAHFFVYHYYHHRGRLFGCTDASSVNGQMQVHIYYTEAYEVAIISKYQQAKKVTKNHNLLP